MRLPRLLAGHPCWMAWTIGIVFKRLDTIMRSPPGGLICVQNLKNVVNQIELMTGYEVYRVLRRPTQWIAWFRGLQSAVRLTFLCGPRRRQGRHNFVHNLLATSYLLMINFRCRKSSFEKVACHTSGAYQNAWPTTLK